MKRLSYIVLGLLVGTVMLFPWAWGNKILLFFSIILLYLIIVFVHSAINSSDGFVLGSKQISMFAILAFPFYTILLNYIHFICSGGELMYIDGLYMIWLTIFLSILVTASINYYWARSSYNILEYYALLIIVIFLIGELIGFAALYGEIHGGFEWARSLIYVGGKDYVRDENGGGAFFRLAMPFGIINGGGTALLFPVLFSWHYVKKSKLRVSKLFFTLLSFLFLFGIIMTDSKGAILASFVVIAFLFFRAFLKFIKTIYARFSCISLVVFVFLVAAGYWLEIHLPLTFNAHDIDRLHYWSVARDVSAKSPFWGIGYERIFGLKKFSNLTVASAHSSYMTSLFAFGSIGLLLFFIHVVGILSVSYRRWSNASRFSNTNDQSLAFCYFGWITAAVIHSFFDDLIFYNSTFSLLFYLSFFLMYFNYSPRYSLVPGYKRGMMRVWHPANSVE